MSKTAIVFLADGFEEVEAITPIDYLRRAGVDVITVSISDRRIVTGSHGIPVTADAVLADIAAAAGSSVYDAMLLPGGMPGAANLAASGGVGALLKGQAAAGRIVAAICASPAVVLSPLGLLAGRRFTCYPGMESTVTGATWSEERVVIDGNIVTSRGAGTAAEWAIALIGALVGKRDGEKVAGAVLL
ncbi:DJ-1 family protein [Spirochaetia bacterium]|nr:DJ-1 family protein [Spirochaetia bacterium]